MARQDVITYLLELQDNVSRRMRDVRDGAGDAEGGLEDLRDEQKKGEKEDKKRTSSLKQLAKGLKAGAAAAAAAGAALGAMGAFAIKTSANLEAFETRLGGLLGGLDKGKERVAELFELSAKTPFSINGLVEAEATLEAFGVNAEVVRGGVMDLAGAMGMDVTEAANAVGKALAGGAGAAVQLRERGVLAMVEVEAGMSTAEMTADEFREALVRTLETNEKIAGGTVKLSQTFNGLFSTLKDQFTVFAKEVGDADLFSTAKASMIVLLELMEENKEAISGMASTIGGGLAKAMVFMIDSFFRFLALIQTAREGFLQLKAIVKVLAIGLAELALGAMESFSNLPIIGDAIKAGLGGAVEATVAEISRMNGELLDTGNAIEEAQKKQKEWLDLGQETVTAIEDMARGFEAVKDAQKGAAAETEEGPAEIMSMKGIDPKEAKRRAKAQKEMEKFIKSLDKLAGTFRKTGKATAKLQSEKLAEQYRKLSMDMAKAKLAAEKMGPAAVAAFQKVEAGMKDAMKDLFAEIEKTEKQERLARVGAGMQVTADTLSDPSSLLGLDPSGIGGAVQAFIGMGMAGQQAVESKAAEDAQIAAEERAAEMEARAEAMAQKGFSEDEIAAAGLAASDISEARQVTAEDIAAARGAIDEDQVMADAMAENVQAQIDGFKAIIKGLPEILSELIPMLLVELPGAIIEALPELIEEFIAVLPEVVMAFFNMLWRVGKLLVTFLFRDLWVAIGKGALNAIMTAWTAIKKFFKNLFSFGKFQTGGFVPKTGLALLHQGERVVPSSGAGTQTATKGLAAFSGGTGPSLTVNTNVVDPDSIPALGRIINRELGAFGRSTVPLFGEAEPITSI